MSPSELANLELLAEVDSLTAQLNDWSDRAPRWPAAQHAAALAHRLADRASHLRARLEAPLVVAMLGGTGTGKSTLVNALVGAEVTQAGRERPTTRRPTLICHTKHAPAEFGFAADMHVVQRELDTLRHFALVDCPDPDTTEDAAAGETNLARLRKLLPHCDVLIVTSTQQKYRSARVLAELASAAPGARLIFVQTHADSSDDIRKDWRAMLAPDYRVGEMFFVDSVAASERAESGLPPEGDFLRLLELLDSELAGTAAQRIRRANFLDLVADTLTACQTRLDQAMPPVVQLETALTEQRARVTARFVASLRDELLKSQRPWENRLLAEVTSRWGFSPFSLVLRAYAGLGGILSGWALFRARTPAQIALWGVFEGGRVLRRRQQDRSAEQTADRAVASTIEQDELRTAAIIVDGYAAEAGLAVAVTEPDALARESRQAATAFIGSASAELDRSVSRLAERHAGWLIRWWYELLLGAMLGILLSRMAKNFFYDSWLAPQPTPVLGIDFYIAAGIWLWLWCTILVWAFTRRLRRGIQGEVTALAERCVKPGASAGMFVTVESECRAIHRFRHELDGLQGAVANARSRVEESDSRLGHKVSS
jgi:energy-coupling factor transporter ATP-binding protein EcfA2